MVLVATERSDTALRPAVIPTRTGVSPIGTSSPNTGSSANTNSTYGQGAFTSGIVPVVGNTYTVQNTDYQGIIRFNTGSAITVVLNSAVGSNFSCNLLNIGAGAITLSPTSGYLVNGLASLTLASHQGATVFFANRSWTAFIGSTVVSAVPNFADNEVPGGTIDGINVTFTLAFAPNPPSSLILSNGGLVMWQDATGDYTLSGVTITFNAGSQPTLGPLIGWYRY